MNVVIYARYSSHNQTEQSIDGQLKDCYAYAEKNNFTVIDEPYIDRAKSGTKDDREAFQKMIEDSKKGLFNGVIVWKLDRFARNRYDSATYKSKLKKNNVRVMSAVENITDDPAGVITESVLEGMAEYFSLNLGENVKRGMGLNADKCYYNGGTVPLGFKLEEAERISRKNNKPMIKYRYVIDEEKAPIIRKVFEMYNERYLMADIQRYLNNKQIKTAFGNEFNKNSIRGILINTKYKSTYTYNGKETLDGIPRIVDDETFYKAQDMLNIKKQAPARARAKTEYLLTTKLFCGHCKDMMIGISGTSSTGKLHTYYTCKSVKLKKCKKANVQKNYIEDILVTKARDLLTDENIEYIANTVVGLTEKERNNSDLKRLNKLLSENEKQRDNLLNNLAQCTIDSITKSIFDKLEVLDKEKVGIEKEIILEEANCVTVTTTQVKTFLKGLRKGKINDPLYRKTLINVLIYKVYLYDDNFTVFFTTQDKKFEGKLPTIQEVEDYFKEGVVRLTDETDCQVKTQSNRLFNINFRRF